MRKSYEEIPNDPTNRYLKKLDDELKNVYTNGTGVRESWRNNVRRTIELKKIQKSHGNAAPVYGLIKLHKFGYDFSKTLSEDEKENMRENCKLRPVVPYSNTPDIKVHRHISDILRMIPTTETVIESAEKFVEEIKHLEFNEPFILASIDVESMYPSIPPIEAIEEAEKQLNDINLGSKTTLNPTEIGRLLRLITSNCNIRINNRYFQQKRGLPIGAPTSSALANIFLQKIEERFHGISNGKLLHIRRYVDDFFVLWSGSEDELRNFMEQINNLHPNIRFTYEVENTETNSLPFLDVDIRRTPEGRLQTGVFRKPSNSFCAIPKDSHHPNYHLKSAILHSARRAILYCSTTEALKKEKETIAAIFQSNGFSQLEIDQSFLNAERTLNNEESAAERMQGMKFVAVPFCGGITNQLRRKCRNHNVIIAESNRRNLRTLLRKKTFESDPMDSSSVVYQIDCNCGMSYRGQTGRKLRTRTMEHLRTTGGPILNHMLQEPWRHEIDAEGTKVLAHESDEETRVIMEAMFIKSGGERIMENPNIGLNRNAGAILNPAWDNVINRFNEL